MGRRRPSGRRGGRGGRGPVAPRSGGSPSPGAPGARSLRRARRPMASDEGIEWRSGPTVSTVSTDVPFVWERTPPPPPGGAVHTGALEPGEATAAAATVCVLGGRCSGHGGMDPIVRMSECPNVRWSDGASCGDQVWASRMAHARGTAGPWRRGDQTHSFHSRCHIVERARSLPRRGCRRGPGWPGARGRGPRRGRRGRLPPLGRGTPRRSAGELGAPTPRGPPPSSGRPQGPQGHTKGPRRMQ